MILETNLLILTITITLLGKLGYKPYTKSAFELTLDDVRLPFINIYLNSHLQQNALDFYRSVLVRAR